MLATTLDLDANPFNAALKRAESGVSGFAGRGVALLQKFPAAFATMAAAVAGAAAAFSGIKKAIDLGGELRDLSANTGQSVEDLMLLRKAFQNAGLGADAVQPVLAKFQGKLGGMTDDTGAAAEALAKLGLNVEQVKSMTALEQIEALGSGIQKLGDQSEKVNVLQTLFGKTGAKMGALLGDPGAMKDAREQLGGLAGLMQKISPMLDKIGDAIGAISDKFMQLFAGVVAEAGPELQQLFGGIARMDFTGLGRALGKIVSVVLKLHAALSPTLSLLGKVADGANRLFGAPESSRDQSAPASTIADSEGEGARPGRRAIVSSLTASGLNAFAGGATNSDPLVSRADKTNALLTQTNQLLASMARIGGFTFPRPDLNV